MDPVVHFELPAVDTKRIMKFYESVFGWDTQQLGEEFGHYIVVTTAPTDENRMIKEPGAINGGMYQKATDDPRGQHPRITISVDDIQASMKKVVAAGGKVLGGSFKPGEPDDIPGIGLYVAIIDTEGNEVSMLQPAPRS